MNAIDTDPLAPDTEPTPGQYAAARRETELRRINWHLTHPVSSRCQGRVCLLRDIALTAAFAAGKGGAK